MSRDVFMSIVDELQPFLTPKPSSQSNVTLFSERQVPSQYDCLLIWCVKTYCQLIDTTGFLLNFNIFNTKIFTFTTKWKMNQKVEDFEAIHGMPYDDDYRIDRQTEGH